MKPLRIALLAPLKRPILPGTTVSRARVIVDLASGLSKNGHQVTIFATADSHLSGATIVPIAPKGLQFLPPVENEFYRHTSYLVRMVAEAVKRQGEFDLIHNHMYPEYLALLAPFHTPMVTTVHSQMVPETVAVLKAFSQARLVAISHMAKKVAGIASMQVVHNSVDTELFHPDTHPKSYLLAVGRMSKAKDEKGTFLDPKGIGAAIEIAKRSGEHLKIVGNVEDPAFFETLVKPNLSSKIEFVGDVSPEQTLSREDMAALFRGAKALVNPINWEEPFGLVMAEAMASGTPVVAYNRGAVPEIVKDGVTGFIVDPERGVEGFVKALRRIGEIDRQACRAWAVEHFSTERMVREYETVYRAVCGL